MRGLGLEKNVNFPFMCIFFFTNWLASTQFLMSLIFKNVESRRMFFSIFQKVREDFSRERSQILEESATRDYERKGTEFFFCWQKFKAL